MKHTNNQSHELINHLYAKFGQALIAVSEAIKDIPNGISGLVTVGVLAVISLGTGSAKIKETYNADKAAKWGIGGWLGVGKDSHPMLDIFTQASSDMVDIHLSSFLQVLKCEENYLRIQVNIYHLYMYK